MNDKEIKNRGPKRRDETCLQLQHDLTIPAGTILRQESGKEGTFTAPAYSGTYSIDRAAADAKPGTYRKVVA